MSDWKVQRSQGRCVKTGRGFAPGETYHVVLYCADDGLRREDYSEEAWTGPPEDAFCCFKTRKPEDQPDKKKKRLLVDDDVLVDFFLRLKDEQERTRLQFRFVLALILMRKRLVKYEDTREEGGKEIWEMRLTRDRSLHSVINPRLNEEEIQEVSRQLTSVLHSDARESGYDDEDSAESDEES